MKSWDEATPDERRLARFIASRIAMDKMLDDAGFVGGTLQLPDFSPEANYRRGWDRIWGKQCP